MFSLRESMILEDRDHTFSLFGSGLMEGEEVRTGVEEEKYAEQESWRKYGK